MCYLRALDIYGIYYFTWSTRGDRSLLITIVHTSLSMHDYKKDAAQICVLLRHHAWKTWYSVSKEAPKYLAEAGKSEDIEDTQPLTATKKAKKLTDKYNRDYKKIIEDRWSEKLIHGKFPNYLGKEYVDIKQSFQWMKHSGCKGETEGPITVAQDQAFNTRYYNKHIMKEDHTDRCRMCHSQPETVEDISVCKTLSADQYLNRHNQVAFQIHLDTCKHYGINVDAKYWYVYNPITVT